MLIELEQFQSRALTKQEAELAKKLLWEDWTQKIQAERAAVFDKGLITAAGTDMKFAYFIYGEPVDGKRSLYISLHGGGQTTPELNDKQWENQKKLYKPEEGVYVAPRSPSDTWNMWHREQLDPLLDKLISTFVVFADVDPNRVYIVGYSAGGDGVYQLAPRMADRFAGAGMMAGHPNDAEPYGLRNLAFTLQMGGKDTPYRRNEVAAEWKQRLAELKAEDPEGYPHWVEIYPELGHWMEREDASAIPWLAEFYRNPFPTRVVWFQDDVTHSRFYWLAIDPAKAKAGQMIQANVCGQVITIEQSDVDLLKIRFHDDLVDLDQPIQVVYEGRILYEGLVERRLEAISQALQERQDPALVYYGELQVKL